MITSEAARCVSIEAIQRVPLFADLNKNEIQEIARLFREHRFAKGEKIVQEGSTGDTLFLIESGEAGVFIGGKGHTTMAMFPTCTILGLPSENTVPATVRSLNSVPTRSLT